MKADHPLELAIQYTGGVTKLAGRLGIDHSNVSKWRVSGIVPYKHRIGIEQLTGGVIKAADFETVARG